MEGFDFCCIAWKRRTGWTPLVSSVVAVGSSSSLTHVLWQPRTLAIQGSRLLYFENGQEDGTPRGCIDLLLHDIQIQVIPPSTDLDNNNINHNEDGPTPHQIHIKAIPHAAVGRKPKSATTTSTKSTTTAAASSSSSSSPKHVATTTILWKLCFDQQSDLMTCLSHIHQVLEQGGHFAAQSSERFEHDLQTADHIYRWEMIVVPPVIYPIQIHGIVLEAGRNCVVVADFGLTGYSKQQGKEFHHVSGDDMHSTTQAVLAAFKKLRPTQQDQRLHIVTLIDPKEIRKWTKAGYDEESFLSQHSIIHHHPSKALEAVSSWFGKLRTTTSLMKQKDDKDDSHSSAYTDEDTYHGDQPVVRVTSSETASPKQQPMKTKQANQVLPQSDPPEIVLERAHYLLEHMNVLPPYHVFYSNSECIAVWCKTGRWSTLQTAVFLGSNSVGAAKSSTLATLGVAAANPLLAPVVALGGLVWITAPMYILKKSREQWQLITEYMTDVFWSAASAKVFVAAIQHWSGLVQKDDEGNIVAVDQARALEIRRRRRLQQKQQAIIMQNGHDEQHDVTDEEEGEVRMEDMHGPLAPPPMMAPPPPPPLDDLEDSYMNNELPNQINDEVGMTHTNKTATELEDANDSSPSQSDLATAIATAAEDMNGVIEKETTDVMSKIDDDDDDDDEPIEPPVDTQETPSTEYESKEAT